MKSEQNIALSSTYDSDSPADEELLDRFRPVFLQIAEGAIDRERTGTRPVKEAKWLRDSGFTAVRVPRYLGGSGASLRQLHMLLIELAAADSNLSHALRVHFRFTEGHWLKRNQPKNEAWLRKIVSGVVVAAGTSERAGEFGKPSTTLVKDGDDQFVTGQKFYSTGSLYADYLSVLAKDEGGNLATVLMRTNGPGVEVIDDWPGFGQRFSGSGTTTFNNAPVERGDFVSSPSAGSGIHWAHVQLSHLATASGIVRRATDEITQFVLKRERTYRQASARVASEDPLVQGVIGRADAAAYSARAIVLQVATAMDEVVSARFAFNLLPESERTAALKSELIENENALGLDAYRAQTIVLDLALKATSDIFEVGGASAVDQGKHFDRHWRNVRTLASHNPLIYRHRDLGEFCLSGKVPYNFAVDENAPAKFGIHDDASLGV